MMRPLDAKRRHQHPPLAGIAAAFWVLAAARMQSHASVARRPAQCRHGARPE